MGGTALGIQADRMDRHVYFSLESDIISLQAERGYMHIIPTFANKESFGDMDIIYRNDLYTPQDIIDNFNNVDGFLELLKFKRNGNVLSVLIKYDPQHVQPTKQYQIDFIGYNKETYDFAFHYHSYGDRGNLIGRLARWFNLKFGHNGLFYVQYAEDDRNVKLYDHLITNDFREALYILGFSVNSKFEFDNPEEMYKWICSSKLFNKDAFLCQNRPNKDVKRDRLRKDYLGFLEYIKVNDPYDRKVNKCDFLDYTLRTYNLEDKVASVYEVYEMTKEYKKVFNGTIVSSITSLTDKQLGHFMTSFIETVAHNDKSVIISMAKADTLTNAIKDFYSKWSLINKDVTP